VPRAWPRSETAGVLPYPSASAELSAPWGFASPLASAGARLLAPTAEHLILFHLLVDGEATARLPGQAGVVLEPGDIAVLPRGDAHELWNGRGAELVDSSALLPKLLEGTIVSERGGGGGRLTRFIRGYIGCDRQAQRLFLAGLPPLFKVNIRTSRPWPSKRECRARSSRTGSHAFWARRRSPTSRAAACNSALDCSRNGRHGASGCPERGLRVRGRLQSCVQARVRSSAREVSESKADRRGLREPFPAELRYRQTPACAESIGPHDAAYGSAHAPLKVSGSASGVS
jgi:hypothetical protein